MYTTAQHSFNVQFFRRIYTYLLYKFSIFQRYYRSISHRTQVVVINSSHLKCKLDGAAKVWKKRTIFRLDEIVGVEHSDYKNFANSDPFRFHVCALHFNWYIMQWYTTMGAHWLPHESITSLDYIQLYNSYLNRF
jgi:hypothetical protein